MQGFLHFLLFGKRSTDDQNKKSDLRAKSLREWYIFKIIPILNPDGVVCGNYRSTVSGVDLNRQWADPLKNYHPVAYYARKMVEQIQRDRKVIAFCDLHGHSKLQNSFIYGCGRAADGEFSSWTKVRLLPRILAKHTHFFNYAQCRFKVTPCKVRFFKFQQGTARVVLWKDFGITNSFTLETSFLGYSVKKTSQITRDRRETVIQQKQFSIADLEWIGCSFAKALAQFYVLNKQIERETALTNGWLKPYKLIEMTGTTAVEKIVKELEAKERLQRRQHFIKNYLARIGRTMSSSVSEKKQTEQTAQIQLISYDGFSDDGTVKDSIYFDNQNSSSPHLPVKHSSQTVTRARLNSNFNSIMFQSLELERDNKHLDSTLMSRIGTPPSHVHLNQSVSPHLDTQLLVNKKRQQREVSIDRFYSQLKYFQMQRDQRTNYREDQLHESDLDKIYQKWESQSDAKLPEWREYFGENELKNAFDKINQGEFPQEVHSLPFAMRNGKEEWQTEEDESEEGDDDSDSEAELDNLNEEMLADLEISPEHSISVAGSPNNSPRHSHTSDFRVRLESLSFNRSRVSPINEKNEEDLPIRKRKLGTQQTPIDEYVSRGSTPREGSEIKDLDRVSSKESEFTKFTQHKKQNFITEIKIRSQDRSSSVSKRSQYFVHQKRMEDQQSQLRSKFDEHVGSGMLSESNNRSRLQMLPRYHKVTKETETPSQFVVLPVTKINFPTAKQSIPKPQKTKLPFLKRTGLTLNVPPPISMEDRVNALHSSILKKNRIMKLNELKLRKSSYHGSNPPNSASILQDTLFNQRFNKTGFQMKRGAHSQDYTPLGGITGGKLFRQLMGSSYDGGSEKNEPLSGIPMDAKMGKTTVLWDNQGFQNNIVEELSKGGDRTFQSYKFQQKIADEIERREKMRSRQEMRGFPQTEERASATQADSSLAERSTSDKMIAQEIEAIVASIKETHDRHMNKFHLINSAKKKKARETAKLLGFSPFHSNFAK